MVIKKTLGKVMRELRLNAKVSQSKMADILNIDKTYLSKLENDRVNIKLSNRVIDAIAAEYGISQKFIRQQLGMFTKREQAKLNSLLRQEDQFPALINAMYSDIYFRENVMELLKSEFGVAERAQFKEKD